MTEPDVLSRDIDSLKALQRNAWRELASPSLTVFDRREVRNRIRQSEAELKTYLQMRSERAGFPVPSAQTAGHRRARPSFRLLAAD
jgi:hypothetical protein